MNIIISNISKIKTIETDSGKEEALMKTNMYESFDGSVRDLEGVITNEAPIKMLIKQLSQKNDKLDYVCAITSDLVNQKYDNIDKTSFEVLENNIKVFCENEDVEVPIFETFDIENEPTSDNVIETVMNLDDFLKKKVQTKETINVYIESNGGIRYVLTMILSICNALEGEYDNFEIKQIYSMIFDRNHATKILETKDVFDSIQVPTIINEFLSYGRTEQLKKYFEYMKAEPNTYVREQAILDKLDELTENIFLCRVEYIIDGFYGDNNIHKMIDDYIKDNPNPSGKEKVFVHILNAIKSHYLDYLYYRENDDNKELSIDNLYLPNMINWCLDKGYVQQALTLAAERYPRYMYDNGYYEISDELEKQLEEKKKKDLTEKNCRLLTQMKDYLNVKSIEKIGPYLRKEDSNKKNPLITKGEWEILQKEHHDEKSINEEKNTTNGIVKQHYDFLVEFKSLLEEGGSSKSLESVILKYNCKKQFKNGLNLKFLKTIKTASKIKATELNEYEYIDINKKMTAVIDKIYNKKISVLDKRREEVEEIYKKIVSELEEKTCDGVFKDLGNKDHKKRYIENYNIIQYINSFNCNIKCKYYKEELLQKKVFLWALCKDQRNISNHASEIKKDRVALDSAHLMVLIKELIKE